MNITPLIDVVFLLIIFFMLVSNIVAEETVDMIVPALDEPQTVEFEGNKITVSVALAATWDYDTREEEPLGVPGEAQFVRLGSLQDFNDLSDLSGLTEQLAAARTAIEQKGETLEVLLRADGAIYYGDMERVYAAISEAGVETIHMVAFLGDE